uniref:Translocation protein SEC62 n=1 Tax=Panagrellus redivivus TaxID=6233 RepID=A0A7E4VT44_PANRE
MANRRRQENADESVELTPEEDTLARFLRFNCPTKTGTWNGNEHDFFVGQKAVDTLLESKKYGAAAKDPKFKTKGDAEVFIRSLIDKGAIFRANKVVLKKKSAEEKRKGRKQPGSATSSPKPLRTKDLKAEDEKVEDSEADVKRDDEDEKKEKKKKIVLVHQQNQSFTTNTTDVYVWVFDPTPFYKKVIGALILVAVILGCLFPLWPEWLRLGVYYLSMGGIIFLVSLLSVALLRTILFGIIYAASFGQHKLWVLPNLTEDCGFFESFKPFYSYEYCPNGAPATSKPKKEKKTAEKKELIKESAAEETPEDQEEDDEEEDVNGTESASLSSKSSNSGEAETVSPFEVEPAEEFVPEESSRRRRRPRKDDVGDFVLVDGQ